MLVSTKKVLIAYTVQQINIALVITYYTLVHGLVAKMVQFS